MPIHRCISGLKKYCFITSPTSRIAQTYVSPKVIRIIHCAGIEERSLEWPSTKALRDYANETIILVKFALSYRSASSQLLNSKKPLVFLGVERRNGLPPAFPQPT